MVEVHHQIDSMTTAPCESITWRCASTVVSVAAELILIIVTLVIISAMWLPAYLTSTGQTTPIHDANHDEHLGFAPHR